MVRVKRGKTAHKRRKRVLKHTKGFKWGRKTKYRLAKQALMHAWAYAYRDRRTKKRNFRRLQQTKINAASRRQGIPYSKLINMLKKKKIELDRKILADLAENNSEIFEKIIKKAAQEK
ncbi:50S ribosomal protein L20 [Parcubacteria bacterium DG_72]|nr:MAG: 50S ribosomal protein L20 [Parcubacteria bacterium DG_72]